MNRVSLEARRIEIFHDLVGAVFRAGETRGRDSRRRRRASRAARPAWSRVWQKITLWAMRSAVDETGATVTSTGLLSSEPASLAMAGGMVAEKNRLWRLRGSMPTIF